MKNINNKIIQLVSNSLTELKNAGLSRDELSLVKSQFIKIYNHNISAVESNFQIKTQIADEKFYKIDNSLFSIGSLLALLADGPVKILKDAYQEDYSDIDYDFLQYQFEVFDYTYSQVQLITLD